MPWSYDDALSNNPNLTLEHISDMPDAPWVSSYLVVKEFDGDRHRFIAREYRKYLAAYRIQQWWHRLRLDPRHPVGRRRLDREYTELFGQDSGIN